ncbi:MAG: hypothetical protein LBQ99_00910 [Endomicrobium sp.]|jgi:hypothetical protein|nr:hypothetical protein [Endomicrobium sp.]
MRKIKNFRVNLHVKEVSHLVKRLANTAELLEEIEKSVRRYCCFYYEFISPSLIYETFSREFLSLFVYKEGVPSKWIAGSIFFVTLGDNLYKEYEKNEETFGEYTGKIIISALAINALKQSRNFTQKLVLAEAREENCELSEDVGVYKNLYKIATKDIPIKKIGVSVESEELSPKYSSCGLFYWIPSKKRQKVNKIKNNV